MAGMGDPVNDEASFEALRARPDDVLVIVHGAPERPLLDGQHSLFIARGLYCELQLLDPAGVDKLRTRGLPTFASRHPMAYPGSARPRMMFAHLSHHLGVNALRMGVAFDDFTQAQAAIVRLRPEFVIHFDAAVLAERQGFAALPYSFGVSYNCHTFVLNVLRRLLRARYGEPVAHGAA